MVNTESALQPMPCPAVPVCYLSGDKYLY